MEELWSEVMSDPKMSLGQDMTTILTMNGSSISDPVPSEGTRPVCENGMCSPQVSGSDSIEFEDKEIETSQSLVAGSSVDDEGVAKSFFCEKSDPVSTDVSTVERSSQDYTIKEESNVKQLLSDFLVKIDNLESNNTMEYSISSDHIIEQKSEELKVCGNEEIVHTGSKEGCKPMDVDSDLMEGSNDTEAGHAEMKETIMKETCNDSEFSKLEDLSGTDDNIDVMDTKDSSNITNLIKFDESCEGNQCEENADKKTLRPEPSGTVDSLEKDAQEASQNGAVTVPGGASNDTYIQTFDEIVIAGNGCKESTEKQTSLISGSFDSLEEDVQELSHIVAVTASEDPSNETSTNIFDELGIEGNGYIENIEKTLPNMESSAAIECQEQKVSCSSANTVPEDSCNKISINASDEVKRCIVSEDKLTSITEPDVNKMHEMQEKCQNNVITPEDSNSESSIIALEDNVTQGNRSTESEVKILLSHKSTALVDSLEQAVQVMGHKNAETVIENSFTETSIKTRDDVGMEGNRSVESEAKKTLVSHMSTAVVDSLEQAVQVMSDKKTDTIIEDSFTETSINTMEEVMIEGNRSVESEAKKTLISHKSTAVADSMEQAMQMSHKKTEEAVFEDSFAENSINTMEEVMIEGNGSVESEAKKTIISHKSKAVLDSLEQAVKVMSNEVMIEGNGSVENEAKKTLISHKSPAVADSLEQAVQVTSHKNAETVIEDSFTETSINTHNEFAVEGNGCIQSAGIENPLSHVISTHIDCQEQDMQELSHTIDGTVCKNSIIETSINNHEFMVEENICKEESADKMTSVSQEFSAGIDCMEEVMPMIIDNCAVPVDSFQKPRKYTHDYYIAKENGCLGSVDNTIMRHESSSTVDCLGQSLLDASKQFCETASEMSEMENGQIVPDAVQTEYQVKDKLQKEQLMDSEKHDPCKLSTDFVLMDKKEFIQPTVVTEKSGNELAPDESGSCKEDSHSKTDNSMEMSWSQYQEELSKTDPVDHSNSIPNFDLENIHVDQSDFLMNADEDSSKQIESGEISSSIQSGNFPSNMLSECSENSVSGDFQAAKKQQAEDMDLGVNALSKDERRSPIYNVTFDCCEENGTNEKSLVKIKSTNVESDSSVNIQMVTIVSEYTDDSKEEASHNNNTESMDTSESVSQNTFMKSGSESFCVESERKLESFIMAGDLLKEIPNIDKAAITVCTSNIEDSCKLENSHQLTKEISLQSKNMEVNDAQAILQTGLISSDSKVATQSFSVEISDKFLETGNIANDLSSHQLDPSLSALASCIKEKSDNSICPSGVMNEKMSDTLNRLVPKKAKARKSGVPLSVSRGASIVKDFTNVTFNLKDLEKAGVVDLAPKPGKKTIIKNRLSIGNVIINTVLKESSGRDKSPLDKKLKPVSPKKSPLKSPLSPEKLMRRHSRKRKRVKMGSYRLPSEIKKIKREKERKKEKEDSDSVKSDSDIRINNYRKYLAEKKDLESGFVKSVESLQCDNDKLDDPNKLVSALDMLTKNSKNLFSLNMLAKKSKTSSILGKRTGPKASIIPQKGTLDSYLKKNQENFQSLQNSNFKTDDSNSRIESSKRDKSMEDIQLDVTSAKKIKTDAVTLPSSHTIHQPIQQMIQQVPIQSSQLLSPQASFSTHHSYTTTSGKPLVQTTPTHYTLIKPTLKRTQPYSQHASVKSPTGQPQIIHVLNPHTPSVQKGALRSLLPTFTSVQGPITLLASPPNSENGPSAPNGTIKPVPMVLISSPVTSGTMTFAIAHTNPSSSFVSNPSLPRTAILTTKAGQPLILTPVQGSSPLVTPQTYSLITNHTTASMDSKSPNVSSIKPPSSVAEVGIASQAPVLNRLLTQSLSSATPLSTISSPVIAHVHSSVSRAEGEGKVTSLPNGLCYPVTPPRTPDGSQSSADSQEQEGMAVSPDGTATPDRDVIPLCCCKINGASFQKLASAVTYCQALDSVDGKVMGCCNKVTNPQLVRPAVKIPFMAVCEVHRKRLRLHQCCPGCGHFCTQGKFYQCRKEGSPIIHNFHKLCQVFKSGKYFCPHCGEGSSQYEVMLQLNDARSNSTASLSQDVATKRAANKAKLGTFGNPRKSKGEGEDDTVIKHTLENSKKVLSTAGIPLGPDRYSLEKVLSNLSQERPKKYRTLPKSLYLPARDGDLDKVVYMLEDGYDPDVKNEEENDETALHAASSSGSLSVVHILAQAGASIHVQERSLRTPLMFASESNHPDIVKYLIKAGAIVDAKADDGMTALHYAAKEGHLEVIRILLDSQQIDIDIKDDGGWTPLIWAAEHQNVHVVRFLLQNGADPNLRDNEENTSLHWAAFSGSVDIAEIILNTGCDLDTPNMHGDRPLHIAARQDHYECVVLYLARGADVEAKNNKDEAPIGCCIDQNSPVWLALRVNKQLKGFAAKRLGRPEKLLHRDISKGRENIPIPCVNAVDEEIVPQDFQYVTDNVETSQLNINRVLGSLQSCHCKDDCSSIFCACGRSSVRCWYDKDAHLIPEFNMLEPPFIFECNRACKCWTTCNNRVVQNGVLSRLQVFRTAGRGWGVKTLVNIPHGTFICEYIGEYISDSEADRREDDSYLFDLDNRDGETYCIDARRYGNVSRFINHLCEPNLVPVKVFIDHQDLRFPRISFFSSRDIKAQEELGFDYGEKFWIIKWKQFTCACGSPRCKYSMETIQKTLADYKARHEEDDPKQE